MPLSQPVHRPEGEQVDRLLLTPSPLPNSYRQELRLPSGCKQPWNRGLEGTVWAPAGSALSDFYT